ncbi:MULTISPECIES: hypothetical protein [unclassified Vibrio]|uniref:hypothetical protein n=1 Tax=Vibrio TaxID=662 RepID=UPI00126943D3|nr:MULTISPECIES: hypothetical protein [unclassified Vibrio]QFT40060.1 hypothetical protein FIU99_27090 [Vibrio sp. THAF64]QGM38005.1 hypothetical protein GGC04_27295 [Vibrio sp. THAF191d]QGN73415.1 hypothetical protein GGC03_26880 [Vibrio sp. THAF191c]
MQNEKTTPPAIDIDTLNGLLAAKQIADDRLKKALLHRATFTEDLQQKDENGETLQRIVCIAKRGNTTTRLINYIDDVKKANKELLERAPQYFDSSSLIFREPTIIYDARKITLTINKTASTRTVTGKQIAKMVRARMRNIESQLRYDLPEEERSRLEDLIVNGQVELDYYDNNPDKKFKRRSFEHRDVIAICRHRDPANPSRTLPAAKTHVNSGGLIIIRHRSCLDSDINIIDNTGADSRSIYDEVVPLQTILDIKAQIYDDAELELVREARKKLKSDNINKPRSQFDGLVN